MSPFEQLARERKASALVAVLLASLDPDQRSQPEAAHRVRRLSSTDWEMAAVLAGVNPPSPETRAVVLEKLCMLVNAERRGAPMPCTRCDGSGERAFQRCLHMGTCGCAEHFEPCDCLDGLVACTSCGDRIALVVTPIGYSCAPCARLEYPELSRAVAKAIELVMAQAEASPAPPKQLREPVGAV